MASAEAIEILRGFNSRRLHAGRPRFVALGLWEKAAVRCGQ
jgi:hypothetical protein